MLKSTAVEQFVYLALSVGLHFLFFSSSFSGAPATTAQHISTSSPPSMVSMLSV